jgi:riboflavin biosynthesis pyrimidine reductase
MQAPAASGSPAPDGDPVRLERLARSGGPGDVREIVEQLGLWSAHDIPEQRPRVLLNMISTVDGRASLGGRSGPLSDAADRAVFHELRGGVDGVLVGAGTVRSERYGRMIPDAARRELRRQRGQSDEPLACIVSGRLALDGDIPLLREPSARVAILTASAASLPASAASVEYIRTARDGRLDLAAALGELRARFAVDSILCEGGPHLGLQLLEADLLDELFLSLSPLAAGGEPSGGEALRILAGAELEPPAELELLDVLRSDSRLFLRYGVLSRERVSRETMPSSSLAS